MTLLSRCWRWLQMSVPSDEQLDAALPKTLEELRARHEQLEVCCEVARRAVAARNVTGSPIHRKAS